MLLKSRLDIRAELARLTQGVSKQRLAEILGESDTSDLYSGQRQNGTWRYGWEKLLCWCDRAGYEIHFELRRKT